MKTQTILRMYTKTSEIRSEATGWSIDSGKEAHREYLARGGKSNWDFPVGMIGGPKEFHTFQTVLHALGAGFTILAPPIKHVIKAHVTYDECEWEWWLVKEEESPDYFGIRPKPKATVSPWRPPVR